MMQLSELGNSLHQPALGGRSYRSDLGRETFGELCHTPPQTVVDDNDAANFVIERLETAMLDSEFFRTAPTNNLPHFSGDDDVTGGLLLGTGQFGMVYSVESLKSQAKAEQAQSSFSMPNKAEPQPETADILYSDEFKEKMNMLHGKRSEISCLHDSLSTFDSETDTAPESTTFSFSTHNEDDSGEAEAREEAHHKQEYMATHVHRRGKSRYVIKRLKNKFEDPCVMFAAAADIASEALILANIKHTSIITIRATVGTPGKSDFGIILDRLQYTLKQKIKDWADAKKLLKGGILQRLVRPLGCLEDSHRLEVMHSDRLLAVYDIARALQYLHDRRLIFRDLKPGNVGVNLRGDYMLFDFGLAKELKKKDLVQSPDSFKATGLTGSLRHMAPEVVICDNYGFSADVYSFGLVFWEAMALKTPYGKGLTRAKHFKEVVQQGRRPDTSKTRKIISPRCHSVMEACWSKNPSKRPNFDAICENLKAEIATTSGECVGDRSAHLFDKSICSKAGD